MERRERWTLVAAILGSGIVFLDSTVVNVALPRIGADLPRSLVGALDGRLYVYNGYLLTLSSLLILAGALSDRLGRRRMFAVGLAGFGATSALCGLAPSIELLIAARLLQGAAGALLVPGSLSILTATFQGEARGRAFGLWAGMSGVTTILGPVVGGLLVDSVSWRAVFLINLPFVALALWATWQHVAESRDDEAPASFDWLGAIVIALAVGGLTFGLIQGQDQQWRDPLAFAALAVGVVATIAFPVLQARIAHPLVPLSLFRSRNFNVTNLSTLLIYGALYIQIFVLALFLQGTVGYSAAASGAAGIPATLFLIVFSPRFGALAGRYGPRRFMAVGPAIMGVGLLWYLRMPASTAAWSLRPQDLGSFVPTASYLVDVLPAVVIFGMGLMVMVAPLTTALMGSVPVRHAGVASAVNNAISRVGPQLAGALMFVAITASFYAQIERSVPGLDSAALRSATSPFDRPTDPVLVGAAHTASVDAFHLAMLVSALLLFVGAVVNAVGIRDPAPDQAPTVAGVREDVAPAGG